VRHIYNKSYLNAKQFDDFLQASTIISRSALLEQSSQIYFLVARGVQDRIAMAFADGRTDETPSYQRLIRSPLFLAIAGLWVVLAVAEWVRPCFFLHDDNATSFIGMYVHDFRVLSESGRVAEVNYYQYGGEPFLEQGQSAVLYPPVYAGAALAKWISGDVRWTIEWLAWGHLTFGLMGFYFWLRQGAVQPWIAAMAGLAWVLCPFILIFASSWVTATYVAAWLPWLFWALDRLFAQPTLLIAFLLGAFLGLFFLQGYVQWVVYSALFLGLYTLFRFIERTEVRKDEIAFHLVFAALVFFTFTLPLLMPMFHAMNASAARGEKVSLMEALYYHVELGDLVRAQVGWFRPGLIFGGSTAIICCPALLFFPLMLWRFFMAEPEIQRRLFPLMLLALVALVFSTRWHYVLSMLPLLEKFRWPLKVFVFVNFFLIAALAWSVSTWSAKRIAAACVAFAMVTGATVSLACHDANVFSDATLPSSQIPLPSGVDTANWRVIAAGDAPYGSGYRYLSLGFATYFGVPSLGGYDPLVTYDRLDFALGLDYPNVYREQMTPDMRKKFESRGVRYWIVYEKSMRQLGLVGIVPGARAMGADGERLVVMDTQASPLVYSAGDPTRPVSFTYSGNSILIPVDHTTAPVEISMGPTDGWWYRIDHGRWLKAVYQNDRLEINFGVSSHEIEISFFDARFYQGLYLSVYLAIVMGLIATARYFFRLKEPEA